MLSQRHAATLARGTSLIEVMITLMILAFGLLGVAALQSKIGVAEMESYQRAQALMALTQMTERMTANPSLAVNYVTAPSVGTGDTEPATCTGIAMGPNRDLCEWSNTLKGAAELSGANNVGGMQGAVGCVTQLQAANPALGACQAGIYQVAVAWQGMAPTTIPVLACGANSFGANDAYRRVISATVSVGTTSCY